MSDVVTGEAVVVEVRVAQLPSRALALFIDMGLQFLAIMGLSTLIGMLSFVVEEAVGIALTILLSALILVGYPVIFETLSRGRSLGKLALGLRVVSDDGGPERFRQALFRGLSGLMEFWAFFGAPALISSLISSRGKRLGDVFAGTIVISERGPRQAPPPEMPPPLAAWATMLELSRLPEGLAATARQYLSRWHQLSPVVRQEMGTRITTQFAAFVSPPPPPGVPPFAYLAAVLAERRRRTEIRLAHQMRQVSSRYGAQTDYGGYGAGRSSGAYEAAPPQSVSVVTTASPASPSLPVPPSFPASPSLPVPPSFPASPSAPSKDPQPTSGGFVAPV